jgi:nicotinamidase/pyrazinamidase
MGLFSKPTLIILDVQNDFVPGGALPVPDGNEVVPFINGIIGKYKSVVATKDWHPPKHCSFASKHPGKFAGDRVDLEGMSQVLWPDHCIQDTPGADYAAGLETDKIEKVFEKGVNPRIDSYSGLYDNDFGRATGLEDYLKEHKVKEAHIVGLATDYTVKFTALDCVKAGFATTVLLKGCRALAKATEEEALEEMKRHGVKIK